MTVAEEIIEQIPTTPADEEPPRPSVAVRTLEQLAWLGRLVIFGFKTFASIPYALVRHRNEVVRLIADVTFGGGLMAVAASTVLVVFVIAAFVGITIGLEGYQGLQIIGLAPLAGYLSSYANTREIAPLITAFGLAAQMGCKFTTQLGAMRITEEIDALEVMSIRSLPYLVTTRLIAALVVVTPLYLIALSGAYLATQITVILVAHQGGGTYAHYFHAFLTARDILLSMTKVWVFVVLITVTHCYYGYTVRGGPEQVGRAAGRAIRASIVVIALSDMLMTLAFWGTSSGIKFSG
ncbi:MAG TPA: ABC transporter permease [Acidimicrobiales bacterium]|jgi:phospholipid/cholesterol/gamma-HCH transport system permease protein